MLASKALDHGESLGIEEGDMARKKDDVARTERWVEKRSGGQQGT